MVLRASLFEHLFEHGPTENVYTNTPVSGLGQSQQGKILQEWARKVLEEQSPNATMLDPEPGTCCNGSRRGSLPSRAQFSPGRSKGGSKERPNGLAFNNKMLKCAVFFRVKLAHGERKEAPFDDLYLVILSPSGLHLIKHDLVTGIGSCRGKKKLGVSGHDTGVRKQRHQLLERCLEGNLGEAVPARQLQHGS